MEAVGGTERLRPRSTLADEGKGMMRRREWIAAALIGLAMTLSSNFTRADEVVDPGSLNIVDPIISKGSNGSYRLMFILENHTGMRSEEHTSELQSLMRLSYAVFCLKKNK